MAVNNLRIVFADCSSDLWTVPICRDIYLASKKLEHELFVIRKGECLDPEVENYINLDYSKYNFFISKICGSLENKSVDLMRQVDIDHEYMKRQFGEKIFSKEKIQKILEFCFAEATVIYKIIQPDIVIVWNGLLGRRGIYSKVAKFLDIPVYYAEKGMLPDSWYIDPKGINALSTVAGNKANLKISAEKADSWRLKLNKINNNGQSAWEQPDRRDVSLIRKNLGINRNQKVIFFPGQVDFDSNIILFSKNFENSLDALKWVVKRLPKNEFFILAKPHPKGELTEKDFQKVIGNKGKAVSNINIIDAIEIADCIISINSTVTFEATIKAKPVLLLGQGVLNNKSFVSNFIPGKDAYSQIVECIERHNKHKNYFFNQAMFFAAYLDSEYYAYKGNVSKALQILKGITGKVNKSPKKAFAAKEIMSIFSQTTYKEVRKWFPARVLVKALIEKIKRKFKYILFNKQ